MTADKEPMFWASNPEWFRINAETDQFELTDKAPERARISFEAWKNSQDRGRFPRTGDGSRPLKKWCF